MKGFGRSVLIVAFLIVLGIGVILTALAGPVRPKQIICEDGEEYVLEEHTALPAVRVQETQDLIVVDTRQLRLTYYRNGQKEVSFPVAVGEDETPTPIGEWRVIHKGGNWGDGFGARWIGIDVPWGIYGIHGTNKPWTIGSRASHGCVRMFNRDVLRLYGMVKLGTPVHILGDLPQVRLRREYTRKQSGPDVLVLQFAFRRAGFDPGSADGRFGPAMESEVVKFQTYYGLPPTGKITVTEEYLLGLL